MIDALVKFGVKDQNVVLSTIAKIKKGQKELSKKVNVGFNNGGGLSDIRKGINAQKDAARMGRDIALRSGREKLAEMKKEQTENNKLVKSTKAAGEALSSIARSAATLDPVAFIQGALSAAGKVAGSIPFAGGAAQGALELAGVSVGAAAGAVGSAKSSTANTLEIRKRNQLNNLYGSELSFGKYETALKASIEKKNAAKIAAAELFDKTQNESDEGIARIAAGGERSATAEKLRNDLLEEAMSSSSDVSTGWTPTDKTQFIQSISGQFGKIGEPLAKELNKYIAAGKNVEQFTQVASGNWSALGTDEGAILQQISNSFSGALPSIKQEVQAALLKSHGDKIQNEDSATTAARSMSARWARQDERHDLRVAAKAASMGDTLFKLDASLKEVQVKLISGANKLAEAVNKAVDIIT